MSELLKNIAESCKKPERDPLFLERGRTLKPAMTGKRADFEEGPFGKALPIVSLHNPNRRASRREIATFSMLTRKCSNLADE